MCWRRLLVCWLLLMQLGPVLAFMPAAVKAHADELMHACVHQVQTEHHHVQDATLTLELSSDAPAHHTHHDTGHHLAVLMMPASVRMTQLDHAGPPEAACTGAPAPFLEGPLRPPRLN
jgi:hypothetical protein